MSEQRLREAARVLRERAETAYCDCGGPACNPKTGWFSVNEMSTRLDGDTGPAAFIATMHPGVGLALADWLDVTARRIDAGVPAWTANALEVTDAILGGAS